MPRSSAMRKKMMRSMVRWTQSFNSRTLKRVAQGDVSGQRVAPAFNFRKKGAVHFGSAPFGLVGFGIFVERAFKDGIFGKDGRNFIPFFGILPLGIVNDAGFVGLVVLIRLDAAVIDGEFFKVGDDGKRQFGRPGVTADLKGGSRSVFDIDGWFFGFDKKLALSADAEGIVRRFGDAADFHRVFVNDIFVGFGIALLYC